jgi:hypothetical protein
MQMETIACPETPVTNYQSTLRKMSEELGSRLHRGGTFQSRDEVALLHQNQFCKTKTNLSVGYTDKMSPL